MQEIFRPDRPADSVAQERLLRALARETHAVRPALLFTGERERRELAPALAWITAVNTAARSDDPAPLLGILREVLTEVETGQPDTALGIGLRPVVRNHEVSMVALRGPLREIERSSVEHSFETRSALVRHAQRSNDVHSKLLLNVLGMRGEKEELLARALSLGLQLVGWIVSFPRDLERGRLRFSVEDLIENRLDILNLGEAVRSGEDERVRALVRDQVQWARAELAKGWPLCELLGPGRGRRLAFVLRWHAASLSAIEARGYRLSAHKPVPAGLLRGLACGFESLRGTRVPF